jgi:hypothetical protein
LGVVEGKKIETGFIFIDGRYLEAPYAISRRGREVSINGIVIFRWARWPLTTPIRVDQAPGSPAQACAGADSMADLSNPKDMENTHDYLSNLYYYQHFAAPTAKQKMRQYFSEMPFVASVRDDPDIKDTLWLTTKDGREEAVYIGPTREIFRTNDELLECLEENRSYYERLLGEGGTVFVFTHASDQDMDKAATARDLGLMAEVLRSKRTSEEKLGLLERIGFVSRYPVAPWAKEHIATVKRTGQLPPLIDGLKYGVLLKQFEASRQMDERLEKLIKETGIKPRKWADLPPAPTLATFLPTEEEVKKATARAAIRDIPAPAPTVTPEGSEPSEKSRLP